MDLEGGGREEMTYWWITILVLTFISRWWPRLIRPGALNPDTYYHLLQGENLRNGHSGVRRQHPRFVLPGDSVYPPGYHYLLALFPKKTAEAFEKISSAIFDTALAATFLWLAAVELQPIGWDTSALFLLGLAFTFSPALVGMGTGPRAYQGTARTLGELLAAVVFVSVRQYWSDNNWFWVLSALIAGSLLLNTSKFGGQVLLFFSCLMGFLLNSVTLLLFPFLCVVGAIIISKGNYWRVLVGQITHLRLYATKLVDMHPTTIARKRWISPTTWQEVAKILLYNNVYALLITKFAIPVLALGLVIGHTFGGVYSADAFLTAWLVSAFVVFFVISRPTFLFLGEADRYLEYAIIPGFIIFAASIDISTTHQIISGIVALHLALYIFHVNLFFRRHKATQIKGMLEMITTLRGYAPTVILGLLGESPWVLAYCSNHRVFFSENIASLSAEELERFFWHYPYPWPDLKQYVEKYGVQLVAASKEVVANCRPEGCIYDFDGLEKVFENDTHLLYQAREPQPG
jgi:hypothetical protein